MLISAWPETSDRAPKVIRKVLIEVVTVSEKLGQVSLFASLKQVVSPPDGH